MTQTQRKSSQSPLGSRNILFQVGESTPISSLDISEYMDHDMVHGVLVEYVWTQWNNHCFLPHRFLSWKIKISFVGSWHTECSRSFEATYGLLSATQTRAKCHNRLRWACWGGRGAMIQQDFLGLCINFLPRFLLPSSTVQVPVGQFSVRYCSWLI